MVFSFSPVKIWSTLFFIFNFTFHKIPDLVEFPAPRQLSKVLSKVARGGCTQLELTETLVGYNCSVHEKSFKCSSYLKIHSTDLGSCRVFPGKRSEGSATSGVYRTMWNAKIVCCANWAEPLISLSDFIILIWYKRPKFTAVFNCFYLFSKFQNLGGGMRANNKRE